MKLKIVTWNVNSLRVRLAHLLAWLASEQPDIVVLQETKLEDKDFPIAELQQAGYHVVYSGQKTYNGVAILSRLPIADATSAIPHLNGTQQRILTANIAGITIVNIYVPNGSTAGSDKYLYKLDWLKELRNYLQQQLKENPYLVVLGDFNIAPTDSDVHDPKAWEGQVLVSEPERMALQAIMSLGLQDTFRLFETASGHYSWWDYRMGAFRRNHGLRIDHILMSSALSKQCVSCIIDKAPRSWERPSDHVPVVATVEWSG